MIKKEVLAFIWCLDGFKNLEHQVKLKSPHFFVFVHLCLGLGRTIKYEKNSFIFIYVICFWNKSTGNTRNGFIRKKPQIRI